MRKLYVAIVLLLCTCVAFAQTQWIGPDGGDWATASNWSNGLPAQGNDATITSVGRVAINAPLIIDFAVTSFSGEITINADVFNIGNFINSGGNMSLSNGALFLNSGSVTFTNDGPFSNNGDFLNYGTFNQNGNGTFNNNASGVFTNYGNITNIGNFTNNGTVYNYGALTNAATFSNNASVQNFGQIINTFVSIFNNNRNGTFENKPAAQLFIDKDFNNAGTLVDNGTSTVNASGLVNNTGTVNINGLFQVSTVFLNEGVVNVVGIYKSNFGTTNNNSTWNNSGTTENVGTFNNNNNGIISNTGTLINASCATFNQFSTTTINNLTNDGVVYDFRGNVNETGASQGVTLNNVNQQPQPLLVCRDIQVQTDENGEVTITAGDVLVDGNAKYCNIVTIDISQTEFSCSDLGLNPVRVTLTGGFGNSSTCDVTVTVVERSPNPCNNSFLNYCPSAATQTRGVSINSVSIADGATPSGNTTYSNFTNEVSKLELGSFYKLDIGSGGSASTRSIVAWIDWNNDGDFDDPNEEVLSQIDNSANSASADVNVPSTAIPGRTRMRVSARRLGDISPCDAGIIEGEVEDYTIKIVSDIIIQNCVGDIVVNASPGATEQVVGWIPPKGFSTCQNGIDIELVSGLDNGSAFPLGSTTNTLRFSDGCENELTCQFTVTVNPTPVNFNLSCRNDVILEGSAGLGGAIANWVAPFPNASCPNGVNLPTQTSGPNLGDFLPIGTRATVCYESSDNCGNFDNCCFEVFVTDPSESLDYNNCPSIITVDAAPGAGGALVTYPNLTANSSCGAGGVEVVLRGGLPSGSFFPAGNTTVIYTASDNCNSAAICTFIVTVNPKPSQLTAVCPNDIVVDAAPGASFRRINYGAPTSTTECSGNLSVNSIQGLPSGSEFPVGNTMVQYEVKDQCGSITECTFNVTINATAATAVITCPNNISVSTRNGLTGEPVNWNLPTVSSQCFAGAADLTLVSPISRGGVFPLGTQEVIYVASNDCGASATCSFLVTVSSPQATPLSCPNDIVRQINPNQRNTYITWNTPVFNTACSDFTAPTQIFGSPSGSYFTPGITSVTYKAEDGCGNIEFCSFKITVDVDLPANDPGITMACRGDIVTYFAEDVFVFIVNGVPTGGVTFNTPQGTSNCPPVTVTQIHGSPSGSLVDPGTETVVFRARDLCGNEAYCKFNIRINPDLITFELDQCPENIDVSTAPGELTVPATWDLPEFTSTCNLGGAITTQVSGVERGGRFSVGQTTVSYIGKDPCGNELACNFFVNVEGTPAPSTSISANCPNNISVDAAVGTSFAAVNFSEPTATSSCGGTVSATQIGGIPSGSNFPLGSTVIFYRLADDCGNVESCAFTVLINESPSSISIACPPNVVVDAGANEEYAVATFDRARSTTDCSIGGGGVRQIGGLPTGSLFPLGNNTIFYQATNSCGDFAVCSFLITVNSTADVCQNSPSVGGAVSPADQTICIDETDTVPTIHTVSGQEGNVVRWEYKRPNGSWTNWGGEGSTRAPNTCCFNSTGQWQVRAIIKNGDCSEVASTPANINVETCNNPTFDCPALSANIGDSCNDGNSNTINDTVQSDCSCAGNTAPPVVTDCIATYSVDGLTVNFNNVDAPISTVKVFSNTYTTIFTCDNFGGTACANNESVTLPGAGTYFIQIQTYADWATPLCEVFEEITVGGNSGNNGGTNPTFDCPALSANIGDSCNDGNSNTINDTVQSDCSCAGNTAPPVVTDCIATYSVDGLTVNFNNVDAPISTVKVFSNSFATLFACDNFGGTPCANSESVALPGAGTYFIQIQTYADWATPLCEVFEEITATGTSNTNGGDPNTTCNNVTSGGSISGDETICSGDNAGAIASTNFPSGGSGTVEYLWLSSTASCPTSLNNQIQGATQSSYTPGALTQTTYFKRLSRRAGCADWLEGESNCIVKTVENCNNNGGNTTCQATYSVSGLTITAQNVDAPISTVKIFDNSFNTLFACDNFGGTPCNNNESITVPGAGTYFIQIQVYADWATPVCDIFEEIVIGGNARVQNGGLNNNSRSIELSELKLAKEEVKPTLKVFPNPTANNVNVSLHDYKGADVEIRLFNQLGVVVKTVAIDSVDSTVQAIDLSSLTNGLYTVVIFAENHAPLSKKMIVRK